MKEWAAKNIIILSSLAILVTIISLIYFNLSPIKLSTQNFILGQINQRINGHLDFENPRLNVYNSKLKIQCDKIKVTDTKNNLILAAENGEALIKLRPFANSIIHFQRIKAKSININAVRYPDLKWNFEKLSKKPGKFKFKFEEFELGKIDLKITDMFTKQSIVYDDIKVYFKRIDSQKRYIADIETNDIKSKNNYIKISGNIYDEDLNKLLKGKSHFDVEISNLNHATISFLNSLFNPNQYLRTIIDRHTARSTLSLNAKLISSKSTNRKFNLQAKLTNLENIPEVNLSSTLGLGDDLNFENTTLIFEDTIVTLNGNIRSWRADNPTLGLKVLFSNLNLLKLTQTLPEINTYIPEFLLEIFNILHGNDYINGSLELSSTMKTPLIVAVINLNTQKKSLAMDASKTPRPLVTNIPKTINTRIEFLNNKTFNLDFSLPVDYSVFTVNGNFNPVNSTFKAKVKTEDLSLAKLKPIVASIPYLKAYKDALAKSIIIGYTSLDLDIEKSINKAGKLSTYAKGKIKFGDLSYKHQNYPIAFNKVNTELDVQGDTVIINSLQGYAFNPFYGVDRMHNYIEARGDLNLAKKNDFNAEIASPKIDAQTLLDSGILDLISKKIKLNSANGFLKDIFVSIKSHEKKEISGKMNFDSVDININDNKTIHKIKGDLSVNQNKIRFDKLGLSLNTTSSASVDGTINQDLTNPRLIIKANNLDFKEFMSIVDPNIRFQTIPSSGTIDANLEFKDKDISGNVNFHRIGALYLGSKYTKYPFNNLNGSLAISKDLNFTNLMGDFGSSNIRDLDIKIENYASRDTDRNFNINLNADLLAEEVSEFIPSGIRSLINAKGILVTKLEIHGNKLKQFFDMEIDLNKAQSFLFSNWLKLKQNIANAIITSKFTVTPQLIYSDNSSVIFRSKETSTVAPIETKLKSTFQVKDWSTPKTLNYYVNFKAQANPGVPATNPDFSIVAPHIISLDPLNLRTGTGTFSCDTFGTSSDRQTICAIAIDKATAQKYGIGDLNANVITADLLSVVNKPLDMHIKMSYGDWNTIPYKNIKFDLSANGDYIFIKDLKARINNGTVRGQTSFNIKTLESSFKFEGNDVPAHELAQGIWGLGAEVPEGLIDGTFEGTTQGVLPDPMFFNMVATTNMVVKNGKLSQLTTMQKILTAVNTLQNFDLNNIFQTLITVKGGVFEYIITSLKYDHGKVSTDKLLLKAPQIEMNLNGYIDYKDDQLWVKGAGLIPKRSQSILQGIGIGKVNLGNLVSLDDLSASGSKEKRFFSFTMIGPVYDMEKSAASLRSSFRWEKDHS